MRLWIVCLLAGASMSLAAEQPADPRPAQAAEAEAPAAAAAPEAAAVPTSADVSEAPSETEAEPAESEEAAAVDPVEAARLQAEKEKAEEREFTRAGFKPRTVSGKKKYCESIGTSGSRIGKQTQCYSPEQVRAILAKESAE
jgi:hypothetical protein